MLMRHENSFLLYTYKKKSLIFLEVQFNDGVFNGVILRAEDQEDGILRWKALEDSSLFEGVRLAANDAYYELYKAG